MSKRIGANGRKKNVRRRDEKRWRRPKLFLAFGITAVSALLCCMGWGRLESCYLRAASMFGAMPLFTVSSVSIQGSVHVRPDELLRAGGIRLPVSLRDFKVTHLGKLSAVNPWIEKVKLVRAWGGTAVLSVRERTPVAMLRKGTGTVALVDAQGVCIPFEPGVAYALPLVSGLRDSAGRGGPRRLTAKSTERLNRFFGRADTYDTSFARRVTQAHFGEDGKVTILLGESPAVVIVDENDPSACFDRLQQVWEMVRRDSVVPSRIDLCYRNLAFVTP